MLPPFETSIKIHHLPQLPCTLSNAPYSLSTKFRERQRAPNPILKSTHVSLFTIKKIKLLLDPKFLFLTSVTSDRNKLLVLP